MRAYDFIREDDETGDIHSNIVTVLSLIKTKIDQGELQAKLPASMVIRMVQNTGVINFSVEDLKAANDEILLAHQSQTKLLHEYANGVEIKIEIIMVHAQDHLMTSMTLREVALEMLELYKKVK